MRTVNYALGMVETVGFPGLVAALDGALKTADVTLKAYQGADAGIVTIYIVGDVASVKVAVEVGAELAERVGMLHGKHVIARPDANTLKMILGEEAFQKKQVKPTEKQQTKLSDEPEDKSLAIAQYQKKTVAELRDLASSLKGNTLKAYEIKNLRKDELIEHIMKISSKEGGDS